MLPSSSFAAFLAFHNEPNTFAYTKCLQSFTGGFNDDGRISRHLDTFLGYFTVRACDTSGSTIVVQLDGRIPFSHVLVNETQAQLAGFIEGQEVILDHVGHTVCESVEVIPLTFRDFDILDKHSSIVEEDLLSQISIMKKGMILPFFISPSISALFRIGRITPETDQPVILHNNSELHIAPVSSGSLNSPSLKRSTSSVSLEKVNQMLSSVSGNMNFFSKEPSVDFLSRCLPGELFDKSKSLIELLENHPSIILTSYPGTYTIFNIVKVVSALDIKSHRFAVSARLPQNSPNLEGFLLEAQTVLKNTEGACCSTSWKLDYVRIHCTRISQKHFHELGTVTVETQSEENKHKKIRSHILSQVTIFPIVFGQEGLQYSFHIEGEAYTVNMKPSQADLEKCPNSKDKCFSLMASTSLDVKEVEELPDRIQETVPDNFGFQSKSLYDLSYQNSLMRECERLIEFHCLKPRISAKMLLLGPSGSGKSSTLKKLASSLTRSNRVHFVSYIDCNSWKGKQAENIEKGLKSELKKLEARRPAVLLLDNLDFFQLQNEDEQRQIGIEKIFHMIRSFIIKLTLPLVVTARKRTTLHKCLTTAGGIRLFSQVHEIQPLNQAQRLDILRELIEPDCEVSTAAKVTENFTVADLKKLAIRIQLEATIRGRSTPQEEDVAKALEHSRPSGHVVQQRASEKKWSLKDVGGMERQKQLLTEVLLWPIKYSELYESCGIQLGRGVLLHGASGCGKTLLAKAFADDSHFNVISVKGPELLSKYIGSSEENVRQVFERARASSPCIILFDELDSLAPRRGSDSTGVTDRVVNQLLTELDGAEGLQGVYVIGSTSRIDLIDPALIRPGRFDHLVECCPPAEEERTSILKVILGETLHSADIDCSEISRRTESWTGADLRALVTNAKFAAARRKSQDNQKSPTVVSREDIESVFEESKPKERQTRKEEFRAGQRVTLA